MTVFLAGATGALGRALVPQLVAGGYSVRGIARRVPTASPPTGVELIEADLLEADLVELVRGCDAVVHIATAIPADRSDPDAWEMNTRLRTVGTRRLLDAALACGVARYIQQSIVMAYPDGGEGWLDEQMPLDDSPSRVAVCGPVIEMEAMVRAVEPRSLGWTILRGGSFVGDGTDQCTLIDSLRVGEVVVADGGSNFVSLINVGDMAAAVVASLDCAPAGSTFNIVDEPLRYGDYVDALADLIGVSRPRRTAKLPRAPSWRCTNHAAQRSLGWLPRERIWPHLAVNANHAERPA